jgi:hypothetical protein
MVHFDAELGIGWLLYEMFLICKNDLNGHPVIAHLEDPRSILDQSQKKSIL